MQSAEKAEDRQHATYRQESADYMATILPEGEAGGRLSLAETCKTSVFLTLTGLAGRGDLLMHVALLAHTFGFDVAGRLSAAADLLKAGGVPACAALLLLPAFATSALYYWHCTKIEAIYYSRDQSTAPLWKLQPSKWLPPQRHSS